MRPVTINFSVSQGSDLLKPMRLLVLNELVSGATDGITWTVRSDDACDDPIVREKGSGVFYDPDEPDVLVITLTSQQTQSMSLDKRYRHELEVEIDGRNYTAIRGSIHLIESL